MKQFTIEDFFRKQFEEESNNVLLETPILYSFKTMKSYVEQLAEICIEDYILYAEKHPSPHSITTKDITQLSNIYDCTIGMCNIMKDNNSGMSLTKIAEELHGSKVYKTNPVALTKYGENQVKTACQLGLTLFRNGLWYLTAVGKVFLDLSDNDQNKYLSICLLRDPFYSRVLCSMYRQETKLIDYMSILSESTQKRRFSSCMKMISFFIQQCEMESIRIHPIKFK